MLLYRFIISMYFFALRLAAFFSPKAKLWVLGRQAILPYVTKNINGNRVVWFHCASLGEFEQGRPLIEEMKKQHPDNKILLTFFSPSGYEMQKEYEYADYICYLPEDNPRKIRRFLAQVNPIMVVFVKYEYWFILLKALHQRNIPTYFVSTVIKEGHYLTKGYSSSLRKILKDVKHFYVQDDFSRKQFQRMGIPQATVVGDTRVDSVLSLAQKVKKIPFIESWKGEDKLLICGSTWRKDEEILTLNFANLFWKGWRIIIAPHDVSRSNIIRLRKMLPDNCLLYSKLITDNQEIITDYMKSNIILIDSIGQLKSLYQYGDAAYIGGGFTKSGIHNTLEPAVFGLPLFYGPNYKGFVEAEYFVSSGGAKIVNENTKEQFLDYLEDSNWRIEARQVNLGYIQKSTGATARILKDLSEGLNTKSFQ